ncbi:MAG: manganese efflux pump [Deltaproteobacteria bacterium]|nr:manganese efflux pump [Deltaproteobacteria bacterium]
MGIVEIILVAAGLAMDAFAVSLAAGSLEEVRGGRAAFRLSFHFGLFQFLMPVIGWYAGTAVVAFIASVDHWVAFGLLAYVGGRMIGSGLNPDARSFRGDPSRGATLVILSLATSIDALAVGLSLAMVQVSIWYPSVVIGIVTAGLSLAGVRLGDRLGRVFGKRMEIAGGIVLLGIGARILLSHLLAHGSP